MTDMTQKERCTRGCIWLGAGVGFAAILMFWLIAEWGIILSVAAGAIVGAVAAFVFALIFCAKDSDAAAATTAPDTVSSPTSASKPAADSGDAAAQAPSAKQDSATAAEAASTGSGDAVASKDDETSSGPSVTEKSEFSGMKPSKELKGQKELAERKGDYKYVAPASEEPAAKKPAPKKSAPKKAAETEVSTPAASADTPAEGGEAVVEAKPETLTAARSGGADDLKLISGVGPKLEQTLNELGFYHFDQVAKWGPSEIAWVDSRLRFKGRIQRDNWMSQAKVLAEGGETEFSARKK